MTTIREIGQSYVEHYAIYRQLQDRAAQRIEELEGQLQRAKDRHLKAKCPSWIDEIVDPIARELCTHFPGYQYEVLGPFGMGAETSIHFFRTDAEPKSDEYWKTMKSITFEPRYLDKGMLVVRDTSVDTEQWKRGSMAELNGMNHPLIDIPENAGIEWLLQYVK